MHKFLNTSLQEGLMEWTLKWTLALAKEKIFIDSVMENWRRCEKVIKAISFAICRFVSNVTTCGKQHYLKRT